MSKDDIRPKIILPIIVLLAIALLFLFWYRPDLGSDRVSVPSSLILGKKLDVQANLNFPDPQKIDFVQYRTSQSIEQLAEFYRNRFASDGFSLNRDLNTSETSYVLNASKNNLIVNVSIFVNDRQTVDLERTTVGVLYWLNQ
ncbi:MAG: hypothetical protein Q8Q06_01640 [bacterium]|nr:hypothetical protein [bacterium]